MRRKRLLFFLFYLLFLGFLMEACARGYYSIERGVGFFSSADDQIFGWYPELRAARQYEHEKDRFNVLLLGGSALTEEWGRVPGYLARELEGVLGRKVNMLNLAAPAHSSLDSYYKYEWLGDKRFDLVIFYHGINEVRANNVPPGSWREDYSHYSWYDEVNFYFRHPLFRRAGSFLPYFIKHLLVQLDREVINRGGHVPTHSPREEWLEYGGDIKTSGSFRGNIRRVSDIARRKGEPLMVMTFAYYSAGDGEDEDSPYVKFTRVWGDPGNVVLGMNRHNEVIRELAEEEGFILLDQQRMIAGDKRYFRDICHFSDEGSRVFAVNAARKAGSIR